MVSSSICGSCAAQSGWMFAVADSCGEPRDVIGVHDLQVREVVPVARVAVFPTRGRDRVQRVANGPVAQGVEMHLEALAVKRGHELRQAARVDEIQAVDRGLAAGTSR